ncbi:helix-turn-helix domain-containing protein [Pelotomaculum isophthalicicum JI]|uniref:Helix-turn-helix domain-containing protein n=1 Tax=Pelotomaculum isophthalicicum JI TaxID=947010 RepID=A0A9X4H7H8_9FIRM|nr:helix-turn-helix domain-containing protein [Pelotomaculum isophthalicicum]MDF9409509.1 helix-turn-helix domain-containing protein [Pelotomaculum isophthalicicum JI]
MSTIFGRPTGLFFSYDAIFERQDLSTLQKLVYIYFCRRANGNGESMPAYDVIARDCGCHRISAIDAVKQLDSKGLVVKHRRKRYNGSDTSNMYVIFPPDSPFDQGKETINDNGEAMPKKHSIYEGSPETTPGVVQDNPRGVVSDYPQKETHIKEYVVVVDQLPKVERISNTKSASSSVENDGAAFDLHPDDMGSSGQELQTGPEEKGPEETPAWEQIRSKVRTVAGADISASFAKDIEKNYSPEKVSSALDEMRRQLSQGVVIRGVGAWLRYALENDIQPDQPAKTNSIPKRRNGHNNRTPRARPVRPETKYYSAKEQEEKKKEFIRSLYT